MRRTAGVLLALTVTGALQADQQVTIRVPVYPVPDDNAFYHYLQATKLFPKERPWDEAAAQLDGLDSAAAELIVVDAGAALEEFRLGVPQACVMPGPGDFSTPFPYLADFRSLNRLLMVEALVRMDRGDVSAAFGSYLDALKLGQDVTRGGPLIHKLVSISCETVALRQIRQSVPRAGDADALAELISRLGKVEEKEVPLAETFAVEWDWTRRSIEAWKADPTRWAEIGQMLQEPGLQVREEMLDEALTELEAYYAEMIAVAEADRERWTLDEHAPPAGNPLVEMIGPALDRVREKEVRHLANLRGTLLVAALELYFVKHDGYPEELAELSPDILEAAPVDPFTGDPFVYRREDDLVYVLYSVGPDMTDDGGVSAQPGDAQGDIVFSAIE
jgi:hypothetical protein